MADTSSAWRGRLSFNGLANAFTIAAINGGRHVNPLFAGDTVFAWSEVLDKAEIAGREDCGALRLRLVATKNAPCADFPDKNGDGKYPAERDPRLRLLGGPAAPPLMATLLDRYNARVAAGELTRDPLQERAAAAARSARRRT